MNIEIIEGNLLDQDVDVIVDAYNTNIIPFWLLFPHGVSGAIKKKTGYKPYKELGRRHIPLGGAVLTSAGKLNYKGIIHVAGIKFWGWKATEKSIRLSVKNAMKIANEKRFKSIAFPIIGSGTGNFNKNKAFQLMKEEFENMNYDINVVVVFYNKKRACNALLTY